jgi:ubiquinone/menaquinone biosynthesis C-methylase UbiE
MDKLLNNSLKNYKKKYILIIFENYYNKNHTPLPLDNDFLEKLEINNKNKNTLLNNNKKIISINFQYNCTFYESNYNKEFKIIKNNNYHVNISNKNDKIINVLKYFNNLFVQYHYNIIKKNPVLLDKREFPKIKTGYSVTDKADGKRMLLFFDNENSFLYSSEPKIDFKLLNKINHTNHSFTLLDGEYLEDLNSYLVFDALFINGQNIQNFMLDNRLKFVKLFIDNIESSSIKIELKTFYFDQKYKDLCQKAYQIYNSKHNYHLDGLIYTPINDYYYNRTSTMLQTYKWKPLIENTIDFLILKLSPSLYGLVVSGGKKKIDRHLIQQHFSWIKEYNSIPIIFYKQKIDNYKEIQDYENKIVEMYYESKEKIFKVHRVREDKMANYENNKKLGKFNGPNGFRTAFSTFNYIKNPLHTSQILCTKSNYWNNRNNYSNKIGNIKKFHGSIKWMLYKKYLSKFKDPYVLEIGGGRGGDLNKLKVHGVKYALITDVNSGGINEAKLRYSEMNKKNFSVDFLVGNSTKNITNKILSIIETKNKNKNNFFDIVSIQFALHYFLKTKTTFQNFYNNVNSFLTPNGYIFATFLDGDSLNKLFKNQNTIKFNGSNQKPIFTIEKKYKSYNQFGSTILVTGKTIGSHEEYLVNITQLVKYFEENNYKLIETQLFSTQSGFKNMSDGSDYSAINRYVVFQKLFKD